jgi:hypothetical protein
MEIINLNKLPDTSSVSRHFETYDTRAVSFLHGKNHSTEEDNVACWLPETKDDLHKFYCRTRRAEVRVWKEGATEEIA